MSAETGGVFADFMDGESARLHRVRIALDHGAGEGRLRLFLPERDAPLDWPLKDIRSIPDQADAGSVVLGRAGDHPARLIVRDGEMAALLDRLCPDLKRRDPRPGLARRLALLGSAALASVMLIIFVLVPMLADRLADLLPVEGERALGESTFEQIRQALDEDRGIGVPLCDAPAGRQALARMRARLEAGADIPYELRLFVLDHPMVNAFALPGGNIVLFRGLLEEAQSAEEIAGVLGHEMGHVASRDPTRLALRSAGSIGVLGLLFGDFAGGALVLFLTERLIQANYSREAEAASDAYSQALLARAGLPSAPMADFFLRLQGDAAEEPGLLSHLASHPDLRARAEAAIAADTVGKAYRPVLSAAQWRALRNICR